MVKDLDAIDFFELKLLNDKPATQYIRNGEMYYYVGSDKYTVSVTDEHLLQSQVDGLKDIQQSPIDLSKDMKREGNFIMGQKDEIYILSFISPSTKEMFMCRCGNVLTDLENTSQ